MTTMASQITSLTVVYSTVNSGVDQRKHQSSASLAFMRGIHRDRWIPRTKRPVTRKMSPFDVVTMKYALRMPLHPFGTLSLHLLNVPLPLIPSRAAWRLIYLMWRIPRSTESYIVWVYCLWLFLVFSTYKRFWARWLLTIFEISAI